MKKVFFLAALFALFATPSFAAITNSAHDLSSSSSASVTGNATEICVYCHTPHGGATGLDAPLWNRTTVDATNFYGNPSGTMNHSTTLAGVNASDAILCLSCHDGSSLTSDLTNPPNSLGGSQPTITGTMSTAADLGTDLSNDHPVGFAFDDTIAGNDGELNNRSTVEGTAGMTGALSYGSTNNEMWCSSCHDVHGVDDGTGSNVPTFLRISNAGSQLCLTCHVK